MGRQRLAKNRAFPPNLYQNPLGYFYYRNPQTKKQKGLGRDRAMAFQAARKANAALATREPDSLVDWVLGRAEYTLAEWIPLYKQLWMEETQPAPVTLLNYSVYWRRLEKVEFAKRRLTDISTATIAKYLDEYKDTYGATAASMMRARLKDIFRWAETQGLIEAGRSPVTATRTPKVVVTRERMSFEQFVAIRDAGPVWLQNAMNIALVTGQRREDIVRMKFSDWHDGRLHVAQGKSGGRTRLALDGEIRLEKLGMSVSDVVKSCRDSIATPYLVHHAKHWGPAKPGHRVPGDAISSAFIRAREAAGIEPKEGRTPVTFHEIRSLAERLYREEQGAEFAQMILGHKNAATTARYDDLRGEWKVISAV
jgi:enterobacteria phage integrase